MYVPPEVVTNFDLEKLMDTSDEWIRQRSGIVERRYAGAGLGPSDLALEASKSALDMAGIKSSELDMIIFATLSPDYYFPGSGAFLQDYLGCGTTPALDIRNQCSGFLYGLSVAQAFIASGQYKRVLLVGAECHSRALNFSTPGRDVSVLFGDGAGACVLVPSDDAKRGVLSVHVYAEGAHRDLLKIESPSTRQSPMISPESIAAGTHYPKMEGRQVFKNAVTRMPEAVGEALRHNEMTPDDVNLYLFHQANLRINEAVMKQLNQPLSKTFNNIERYGNCSAASIPMCLDEVVRSGRVKADDAVCMAAFGAGFMWASAMIRW
jgi:3-oxoacyl-[acyl-carrier-protein] synthase-3